MKLYTLKTYFVLFILLSCKALTAQSLTENIRLNQLGFYLHANKIAVVVSNISANDFYIITADKKDTAYKGQLSTSRQSTNSSLTTRIANFSALQKEGIYIVYVPDIGCSYQFKIADNIHHAVAVASLKGFYYQRVSMPLGEKYAGKWARPAGHPDTEVLIHPSSATTQRHAGTKISCPGGWYDAGDYNKYIVNSGITMGTLLSAYEDISSYFDTFKTNIPESRDKVPDILNEIIYNLRWMLTMQDPNDGGVYHKCTNASFDKMIMPDKATSPRYAVQKGTAATLDFAGVTAQASRIFKKLNKQLPGLSDSCLKDAGYAWQWALQNPSLEYDQNAMNQKFEPKITTGAYGDKHFSDEWFWAACELFATTKDVQYYKVISERINDSLTLPSWGNVYMLVCWQINYETSCFDSFLSASCLVNFHSILRLLSFLSLDQIFTSDSNFSLLSTRPPVHCLSIILISISAMLNLIRLRSLFAFLLPNVSKSDPSKCVFKLSSTS